MEQQQSGNRVLGMPNEPPVRKKVKRVHISSGDLYSRLEGRNNNPSKRNHDDQVREEIAKTEEITKTFMLIDLKSKIKMKPKPKPGMIFFKDNKLVMQRQQPAQPAQEPSQPQTKKRFLPLKELYLDDVYHCGKLEIHWTPNDRLIIKSDKDTIFGPLNIRACARSLTYHDRPDPPTDHSPIFQLKMNGVIRCVTVKLDCSGDEDRYYTGLLVWLMARVDTEEIVRASAQQTMWDSAAWAVDRGSELSTKQGNFSKASLDQGESQRVKRSLINDWSKPAVPRKRSLSQTSLVSMRFTPSPPPSSITASGIKKSRQDTSDLPVAPPRYRQQALRGGKPSQLPREYAIDDTTIY